MTEHHALHDENWLHLTRAASVAHVGRSTLDRYATSGRIRYATMGGRRLFLRHDLLALRESRRAGEPERDGSAHRAA
jgi:hypothetical protein